MRKFPLYIVITAIAAMVSSCLDDSEKVWNEYSDWRNVNMQYLQERSTAQNPDGTPYYEKIVPVWDPDAYVLIHYFNDRALTAGNLSPLYTSTVAVKYYGQLYNDEPFDSSYAQPDSLYTIACNKVIEGWTIALTNMRVGDTCEVVIPYQQAYGANEQGIIKPYSTLKFGIKLVDIPGYVIQ